jgi:predicted PurR-regulated permease PerM
MPEGKGPSKTSLITFIGLLLLLLLETWRMVAPYLLAVVIGGILALLGKGPYRLLRRRGLRPKLASITVTLAILFLVVGPLLFFAVTAIKQAIAFGQSVSQGQGFSLDSIISRVDRWPFVHSILGSPGAIDRQLRSAIQSLGRGATGAVLAVAAAIPNLGLQIALAMISCFFLLIDGNQFLAWISDKLPLDRDVRSRLFASFQNTAISTIWATLAAAGVQAAILMAGYFVLGVPAVFLAGGATFIFAWIPVLGSTPVWVAGAVYLYLSHELFKAIVMVGIGLLAGVVDNFVRPLVLKGRGEMHPLVSLVAIFGGIQMFGIFGVFVGPIIVAVLISLLQIWPVVGRRFGVLAEPAATPPPPLPADREPTARKRAG